MLKTKTPSLEKDAVTALVLETAICEDRRCIPSLDRSHTWPARVPRIPCRSSARRPEARDASLPYLEPVVKALEDRPTW